jgi:hypothetical protein
MQSPQAVLPETRTWPQYLRDAVRAQKLIVDPARIISEAGIAFEKEDDVAIRTLQNLGDTPVYYLIVESVDDGNMNPADEASNPSANNNHGVLAACAITDDGLGTLLDLSRFVGKVLVAAVSGVGSGNIKLATFQAREKFRA